MKTVILLGSLASLLISINIYAGPCENMIGQDINTQLSCEMIKQLQNLNSKMDDTNEELSNIKQEISNIESKLDEIQSKIDSK